MSAEDHIWILFPKIDDKLKFYSSSVEITGFDAVVLVKQRDKYKKYGPF